MPVPETAVHENAAVVLRQHDVWGAGETLLIDAIPIPKSEQSLAQFHLRFGILGPDA